MNQGINVLLFEADVRIMHQGFAHNGKKTTNAAPTNKKEEEEEKKTALNKKDPK